MHIPKSTDLWKLFDITSRPTHALLHNQFSPQASSKSHRGAWRPCQVPGAGGLWEVVPAQGVLGRLGWWAAPLATTWLFRTFMVIPGDCCWPDKVLWMPRRTLSSSLQRFCCSFGDRLHGSKTTLPSLHIPKMLSGCLAFRARIKIEGFKGRTSISKIRGSHRLTDWRGTFPKT